MKDFRFHSAVDIAFWAIVRPQLSFKMLREDHEAEGHKQQASYLSENFFIPGQQRDQINQLAGDVQLIFGQLTHLA